MISWHQNVLKCLWFQQIFSAEILDWIKEVGQSNSNTILHFASTYTHYYCDSIIIMWLQNTNFHWLLSANNITKLLLGVRLLRYENSEKENSKLQFFLKYNIRYFPNVFWIYLEIVKTYCFVSNSDICRRYNSSPQWLRYLCQYSSTIQCK